MRAARNRLASSSHATALAWVVVAPFALWALTRTLGLERGYPGVPLIAFTPYVAALAPVAVMWSLLLGRRAAAAVALLSAVGLVVAVVPRTVAGEITGGGGPSLKVMSVNVLAGSADVGEIAALAEREDVALLSVQELTPEAAAAIEASPLAELLPYSLADPRPASDGIGLYASRPLAESGEAGFGVGQPGLRAVLELPGAAPIEAVAIHPPPPTTPAAIGTLGTYLDSIEGPDPAGPPPVLIGDFNSTLDSARLRSVLDRGYVDTADALGHGLVPTWPSGSWPPPVTIDHVLVDPRIAPAAYEVSGIAGTDHRAVVAELELEPRP